MNIKQYWLILSLLLLVFASCEHPEAEELFGEAISSEESFKASDTPNDPNPNNNPCDLDQMNLRVLFIGNSFTANFSTDIPQMFKELAQFNNQSISVVATSAANGFTLQNHLAYTPTLNLVNQGNWDYVILQENSGFLANGGGAGFTNSVNSFVTLINNSSSSAKIILFQVVPPVVYSQPAYNTLQSSWNTLFSNVAANYNNVFVCNIGQAFTDAYSGAWGHVPANPESFSNPNSLRLPNNGFHFHNAGGFLSAVSIYAMIFRNKPCIPPTMTFINGPGSVATFVPQFDILTHIGYFNSWMAIHGEVPLECQFIWGIGVYPC